MTSVTRRSVREMAAMESSRFSRRARRFLLGALCVGAALAALAPVAHADTPFGFASLQTTVSSDQAGGHPDLTTIVHFNSEPNFAALDGRDKDLVVTLPAGFLGNPNAVPECPVSELLTSGGVCDPASQVGLLTLFFLTEPGSPPSPTVLPVYRIAAQPGHAASFASVALIPTVLINADIGPDGGYRLTTTIHDASDAIPLEGSELDFWGVPADPVHDPDRFGPGFVQGASAGTPPKPFMIYPSDCSSGSLVTTAKADSWENPGVFQTTTTSLPQPTGCDNLSMSPTLQVAPETTQTDSPSGYEVDLNVPQNDEPFGLATPPLREVSVTLPRGVSLSPAVADGLAFCTDAELSPTTNDPAACPDASKIGSVEIDTPLQTDPLHGSIYLGQPQPNALFRLFVVATGPGTLLKLQGVVDPSGGQLKTTFEDNPQLPFSALKLRFFGGSRAALANPQSCGTMTATSELTSWSGGAPSTPSSSFDIVGCGTPTPFAPDLVAGMTDNHARGSGALTLQVSRADGQRNLSTISADLPPGLLADVASVPLCADTQASFGTCSDASQVGTANVAAGAGGHPLWLGGKVYLTGPYNGAPFGLSIVVPAVAGPLNLGTVVVRAAVGVDPTDAHLRVVSDPLPQSLLGIPLRLRRVAVNIDRPGFMLNPSSCAPLSVGGAIGSTDGAIAHVASPFQLTGCRALPFAPALSAALTGGRSQTRRGGHPGLSLTLTQRPGQASARLISVTLPRAIALDSSGVSSICSHAQWVAGSCPAGSRLGSAKASTPILSKPLAGPVYLVAPARPGLPTLGVLLSGQLRIALEGDVALVHNRLRTTFPAVPDVPLKSFNLTFRGGKSGILAPRSNLCAQRQTASVRMVGRNGVTRLPSLRIGTSCGKSRRAKP